MIKVCFNFKIHIPAVSALNEFLKTGLYLQNDTNGETERSIVEKYATNLLPYLRGLENVHHQSKGMFKAGMSINGITLTNLLKHSPEVIEQLKKMHETGCIEILSEPWSHSIVPFFDAHSLKRQIKLHDISIESVFGVIPEVFIVHSPAYLPHFLETVSSAGKKAVFTNLNQFNNQTCKNYVLESTSHTGRAAVIPINYKISKMLQKLDINFWTDENSGFTKSKFRNYVPDHNPVITIYNLTQTNSNFCLSQTITWQKFLRDIFSDNKIIFTSPSQSVEKYKEVNNINNLLNNVLYRSKLEDIWLENKLQIKSFEKLLRINTLMYDYPGEDLTKEWDVLQDMENLFYMNERFKKKKFARHYFNIFDSPDTAFYSYMNVLDNFMDKLPGRKQKSANSVKTTNSIKTVNSINNELLQRNSFGLDPD
jgi:alpha-amylase